MGKPQIEAARRAVAKHAAFVGAATQPPPAYVPGLRGMPSEDKRGCIGTARVLEANLGHLHMPEGIPQSLHERWARTQLGVLQRAENVPGDPGLFVLERAMKIITSSSFLLKTVSLASALSGL